jgi:hypothetical protein
MNCLFYSARKVFPSKLELNKGKLNELKPPKILDSSRVTFLFQLSYSLEDKRQQNLSAQQG